jgi:hypothetical protein
VAARPRALVLPKPLKDFDFLSHPRPKLEAIIENFVMHLKFVKE